LLKREGLYWPIRRRHGASAARMPPDSRRARYFYMHLNLRATKPRKTR